MKFLLLALLLGSLFRSITIWVGVSFLVFGHASLLGAILLRLLVFRLCTSLRFLSRCLWRFYGPTKEDFEFPKKLIDRSTGTACQMNALKSLLGW